MNKRVEATGRVEKNSDRTTGTTGTGTGSTASGTRDASKMNGDMGEIRATSIKEVAGSCNAMA